MSSSDEEPESDSDDDDDDDDESSSFCSVVALPVSCVSTELGFWVFLWLEGASICMEAL